MSRSSDLASALARHAPWALVLSFLVLLPTKTLFNVPVIVMALAGAWTLVRHSTEVREDRALRRMFVLFACIWVPMALALPDALSFSHSRTSVLEYLRFPLMGIFVVRTLRAPHARHYLFAGIFILLIAWCADALWQYASGRDFFGYPDRGSRLVGIFYPKYRLGIVLASLAPLYLEMARSTTQRAWVFWLSVLPLVIVVLLSGSRSGWLMFAVAVAAWGTAAIKRRGRLYPGVRSLAMALAVVALSAAAAARYPGLDARIEQAAGIFSADLEVMDAATARRLSIWGPALRMLRSHWLNGIGTRGFRYEFLNVAGAENFWMRRSPRGVTHPHQLLLEVAVETGTFGIIGLTLFFALGWRWLRDDTAAPRHHAPEPGEGATRALSRQAPRTRLTWPSIDSPGLAIASALCVLVAMFPLNVHKAYYASFWSSLCWWLVFLFIAALAARDRHRQ